MVGGQARVELPGNGAAAGRVRETAQEFEGVFLGLLLKAMRTSGGSGGLFGESADSQTYREMFDQEIGRSLAKAGGIGLAQLILRDQALREAAAASAERRESEKESAATELSLKGFPGAADTPTNSLTPPTNGGAGEDPR
jgi:Rod binding domain-containing protein